MYRYSSTHPSHPGLKRLEHAGVSTWAYSQVACKPRRQSQCGDREPVYSDTKPSPGGEGRRGKVSGAPL